MSLPSYAEYYDFNDKFLFGYHINVGWFLSEDNWVECVLNLPKIYGTVYVKVYDINIPYTWLYNENNLRELYRECQEEYRRKHIGLTKKEVETKDDPILVKEKTILTDRISVMIPMIRKIMPGLIAQDIVGVQPMGEDVAVRNIFQIKTRYSSKFVIIRWFQKQYCKMKESVNKYIIFVKSIIRYYC
jgi:hypothetical protein